MEERLKQVKTQIIETKAFEKFETLLIYYQDNKFYNNLLDKAVSFYYKGENNIYKTLGSFSGKKSFVLKMCKEIIDQDATEYINLGKRGNLAQTIYNILNHKENII